MFHVSMDHEEGVSMKHKSFRRLLTCCLTVAILTSFLLISISLAADPVVDLGKKLESICPVGAKAIDVKVSANTVDKDGPVSVKLTSKERAYVTAIYISPEGDAVVVFPNRKNPDNVADPGKDCAIVGPDTGLKIGFSQSQNKGKILLFVSSSALSLDPLKPAGEEEFITIARDDSKNMETLLTKLAALSKDERFNIRVITPDKLSKPGQGDSLMGLPSGVASSNPESVAGVQGLKNKIKDLAK